MRRRGREEKEALRAGEGEEVAARERIRDSTGGILDRRRYSGDRFLAFLATANDSLTPLCAWLSQALLYRAQRAPLGGTLDRTSPNTADPDAARIAIVGPN